MSFLTVDNLKFLIGILHNFFVDKYSIDIESYTNVINIKEVVYNCMISASRSAPQANTKDKNKITLKSAKDALLDELNKARSVEQPVQQIIPHAPNYNNVSADYEKMMAMRTTEQTTSTPAPPNFGDAQESVMNMDDFAKRLQEIQSTRETMYDARIQATADAVASMNPMADPKDFYTAPLLQLVDNTTPTDFDEVFNNKLLDEATTMPLAHEEVEKYILVNSLDRDYVNEPTRTKFKIRFTNLNKSPVKIPFYANNPTVPYTKFLTYPGMANSKGFYFQGVFYPPYNPAAPLTTELGYEYVAQHERSGFSSNQFLGVLRVGVGKVIIPAAPGAGGPRFALPCQSVLMFIDEVGALYDGNNDATKRAFCTLTYDTDFVTANGRGFIVLTPAQQEEKRFTPPKDIDSLTLSLVRPDGQPIDTGRDGFRMHALNSSAGKVQVTTRTFFRKTDIMAGDTIRISHYTMYRVDINQMAEDIDAFNSFVNRPEGHEVLNVGVPNADGYTNVFYIKVPGTLNEITGTYVSNANLTDTLSVYEQKYAPLEANADGFLVNTSNQTIITLNMTMKK